MKQPGMDGLVKLIYNLILPESGLVHRFLELLSKATFFLFKRSLFHIQIKYHITAYEHTMSHEHGLMVHFKKRDFRQNESKRQANNEKTEKLGWGNRGNYWRIV